MIVVKLCHTHSEACLQIVFAKQSKSQARGSFDPNFLFLLFRKAVGDGKRATLIKPVWAKVFVLIIIFVCNVLSSYSVK